MQIPGPYHQRLCLSGPEMGPRNLCLKDITIPKVLKVALLKTKQSKTKKTSPLVFSMSK